MQSDERTDQTKGDERAPRPSEAGGNASALPTPSGSPAATGPRRPARSTSTTRELERAVIRTDPDQWYSGVSVETRAFALLQLRIDGEWIPAEWMEGMFGTPIECDGTDGGCTGNWQQVRANVTDLFSELPRPVSQVLDAPFDPTLVNGTTGQWFSQDMLDTTEMTRGSELITKFVSEMDHALHSYGVQIETRETRAITRMLVMKFMLICSMAFGVPVVDAASTGEDYWKMVFELYQRRLWLFSLDLTDLYKGMMHYAHLTWSCTFVAVPMTDDQIDTACVENVLPMDFCELFASNQHDPSYYYGQLRAFLVPEQRCGYVLNKSVTVWFWKFLVYHAVFFCGVILVWLLWKCTRLTFRTLAAFCRAIARAATSVADRRSFFKDVRSVRMSAVTVDASTGDSIKLFKLVGAAQHPFDSLEMSVKGSEIRTSGVVPGCVYLVSVYNDVTTYIGMGFRFNDYLVTAQHNIFAMTSVPGTHYLAPFGPDRKGETCDLDTDRMLKLTPEMISRDIVGERYPGYDASVIPISQAEWSRLQVKTLETSDAVWGANVTVYGLEKSGNKKLQRSLGNIVKRDDAPLTEVFYTASTLKGWSGSPVLTGQRKIVALHCGTNGEHNRGLNFAYVKLFIELHEISNLEDSEDNKMTKVQHSFRGRKGRVARRLEELDLEEAEDRAHAVRLRVHQASNGAIWFATAAEEEAALRTHKLNWRDTSYDNEHADLPPTTQQTVPLEFEKLALPPSPRPDRLFSYAESAPFKIEKNEIRLSTPYFKGLPEDPERHLDMDMAKAIGYTPEAFGLPRATDQATAIRRSKVSLSKSLQEAVDIRLNAETPSNEMRATVKSVMLSMLKDLRYVVDGDGVTKEKILSQLHSSAVGSSKSPGLPYVQEGFTSNASLLSARTPEEVAANAKQRYDNGSWQQPSIDFLKLEPTKVSKLDAGLDRNVQAVGLDTQLYFRCHFSGLVDAATTNYRKSPVMSGWSPVKPGDGEFLYRKCSKKNRLLFEYDGIAHEFRAHTEENYADIDDIFVALAVPGKGVTDEKMKKWREDARLFLKEVGKSGYQFADGTLVSKTVPFILNSGRFDTFIRNSMAVLYWNLVGLLDMGYTIDDIRDDFDLTVGGDDVIDLVPNTFSPERFQATLAKYGIAIHKLKLGKIGDGFEFFSWHFSKNAYGRIQWVPTRFSKHVAKLLCTKHENRPEALVAHMLNWVHSEPHFAFFRDAYVSAQQAGHSEYTLSAIPDRHAVISHLRGEEALNNGQAQVEAFLSSRSA